MDSFSTLENTSFLNRVKKRTKLIPSHNTDEIISNVEKLTITIPSTDLNYTDQHYFSIIDASLEIENNATKLENNIPSNSVTSDCQNNACSKLKINTINIQTNSKKYNHIKITNNKQKNISFSNQKLWEINRVNQILHNKISHGVKSTYVTQNPSAFLVKATSTINRERKNKDIVKKNEILAKKLKNVKSTLHNK